MSLRYLVYAPMDANFKKVYYFVNNGILVRSNKIYRGYMSQKECYEVCQLLLAKAEEYPNLRTDIVVEQVCDLNTFEHMVEWVEMEDNND